MYIYTHTHIYLYNVLKIIKIINWKWSLRRKYFISEGNLEVSLDPWILQHLFG